MSLLLFSITAAYIYLSIQYINRCMFVGFVWYFFSILPKQTCGHHSGTCRNEYSWNHAAIHPGTVGTNHVCWMNRHTINDERVERTFSHCLLVPPICNSLMIIVMPPLPAAVWGNALDPRTREKIPVLNFRNSSSSAPGRRNPKCHANFEATTSCYFMELEQSPFRTVETEPLTTWGLTHSYNTSVSIQSPISFLEDEILQRASTREEAGVPFQMQILPRHSLLNILG